MKIGNDAAPHKAIVFVEVQVFDLLPTGECSGNVAHKIERTPLCDITGLDKNEAIRKVNTLLDEVKQQCSTKK